MLLLLSTFISFFDELFRLGSAMLFLMIGVQVCACVFLCFAVAFISACFAFVFEMCFGCFSACIECLLLSGFSGFSDSKVFASTGVFTSSCVFCILCMEFNVF